MATEIVLDFSNAAPVQSAAGADRVPPGQYVLGVSKIEKRVTTTGKDMLVASLVVDKGDYKGKRLVENFVMPRLGSDDSAFGLQRFHGLLVALGFKEQKAKAKIILESLIGKRCLADVDDETMPATDNWPERVRSRPLAFYAPNAAKPTAAAKPIEAATQPELSGAVEEPAAEEEPEAVEATAEVASDEPSTALDDLFDGI